MPLPRQEVDGTTPKYLRDKYAIVGIGETTYTRGSGITTPALGPWGGRNPLLAGRLGLRLNFHMDVVGGGSSTEALIGIAIGIIEAGLCKTVAIFRAMNGFSQVRIGGTGARAAAPVAGDMLHNRAYGWQSAGQGFAA